MNELDTDFSHQHVTDERLISSRTNAIELELNGALSMPNEPLTHVDLNDVFRKKMPHLHLPQFVMHIIGRMVCLDQINDMLQSSNGSTGINFLSHALQRLNINCEVDGLEHLPKPSERTLFVSNHPLGGLDGIILIKQLAEHYDDQVLTFVNDILLYIKPIRHYFIPINKIGRQSRQVAELTDKAYHSDMQLLTFPAGACSRRINGIIQDLEWKKSFVQKAVETQRNIVPIYFDGHNSNFFYWLSNTRKRLGIKNNIEMLLLPRELFKQRNATFHIRIGQPVNWQTIDNSRNTSAWATWFRQHTYALAHK